MLAYFIIYHYHLSCSYYFVHFLCCCLLRAAETGLGRGLGGSYKKGAGSAGDHIDGKSSSPWRQESLQDKHALYFSIEI